MKHFHCLNSLPHQSADALPDQCASSGFDESQIPDWACRYKAPGTYFGQESFVHAGEKAVIVEIA
jgi:hypothetical protein